MSQKRYKTSVFSFVSILSTTRLYQQQHEPRVDGVVTYMYRACIAMYLGCVP